MTTGYIDTNILIDYFGGHPPAKAALERFTDLKLPAVVYIEFMAGLKTPEQEAAVDKVISALFEVVQTDMAICREAARLRQKSRVKLPDLMIYATARVGKGVLVTRNIKDFNGDEADVYVPYGV
ncbi:MAG: PIN domain-containing protein [Rhodospirillales bacterium]|nr:PIN domain-containing protein [Rhodospirillales bacterium]